MDYFSADWHLDHANIIKYDGRPFKTVEQMNETIIHNVCSTLKKGDNLYFLGDFALTRGSNTMEGHMKAISYTGANLFFIKGNHDKDDTIKLYKKYGIYLGEQKKVRIPDKDKSNGYQEIVLNHYRMDVWDKSHHGVWHLHGHSHHSLPERPTARCMDVGINGSWYDYNVLSYNQVEKHMLTKNWQPIDHHGKSDR
jgi:calcineurin-like phosphoesterase family protein